VIGILGALSAMILISSSDSIRYYELSRVSRGLQSHIEKARTQSVYSKNGDKYSIRLFSNRAVIFQGLSYVEGGSTNEEFNFGTRVVVSTTSLVVSTSTITFDRITGKTNNSGWIRLWISNATTSSTTIAIQKTGIIEMR